MTAIFGQGFGPLEEPGLRLAASEVLPRIDFIALREDRASRSLIEQLGVPADRISLTGDDAIELAYSARQHEPGDALGVNVRMAYYARTDASTLETVRRVVLAAAQRHAAPLVPVPISRNRDGGGQAAEQSDGDTARELLADAAPVPARVFTPTSPRDVMGAIGTCRVVVTGSYHGAVFALAQGIPAIGLVGSPYYRAKFTGLAGQFDGGVQIVDVAEHGWGTRLDGAIDAAWSSAERIRPRLLEAAKLQIELSRTAYATVASLAARRVAAGRVPAATRRRALEVST